MRSAVSDLLLLAERLGYNARQGEGSLDVVWEEDGAVWATFELLTSAHVARFLPHRVPPKPGSEIRWRHLVIPASRTVLWQHKLNTQPWLAQEIKRGGWTFVKFEHLHNLVAREDITLHDFKAVVGLLPPVESGEAQLPLF
jgi:hypothetical protein